MNTKLKTIKSNLQSLRITSDPAVNALKYTWPALKLALTVLEKTLDGVPIPGLKGAIGGFLELAKTAEAASIQNSEDVLELQKHVTKLTRILKRWSGVHELPPELIIRIETFFGSTRSLHAVPFAGS
ncbi:hypothetical protein PILCRDRAFT_262044 [Piloderma croceum F 1598]|uniref:Uncharacterized protein n=1 Tax=Piloderma croceum (strain F 1598) TaxID=765440 RepID=A0A0C3CDM5_PILCF|nr:hypothetical protein PILCRDRAFT_262044 [Piloderma croceum F 1598]